MNNHQTDQNHNFQSTTQSINLIDGLFSPSDAADILITMIEKKINFHKLQMLQIFEGNHEDPCNYDNSRLSELKLEKERLEDIIKNARQNGKKMNIQARINIEMID